MPAIDIGGIPTFENSDVDRRESLTAPLGKRRVDADPIEPREQSSFAAVAIEVAPSLDERVLNGLFDISCVVEDPDQDDAELAFVAPHNLCEGIDVARLRELNELGI